MKVTLAQANPTVGDVEGNLKRLLQWLKEWHNKTDLLVFPELYLSGYPPKDLLARAAFIDRLEVAVERIIGASNDCPGTGVLFGVPRRRSTDSGLGLCNSALLIADGSIVLEQHKALLPTYDVFDEARYFDATSEHKVVQWGDYQLGVCICEDAWHDPDLWSKQRYHYDPVAALAEAGANFVMNLSASPFHRSKGQLRRRIGVDHAERHGIIFGLVNQVGANDELIFDGASFIVGVGGKLMASLPEFSECLQNVDLAATAKPMPAASCLSEVEQVRKALVLGVQDYFSKTGAKTALIGLSGGIDSAVVACVAAEALGPDKVYGMTMPGPYSSIGSEDDSEELAAHLGIHFEKLPMGDIFTAFLTTLAPVFKDLPHDLAEENVQARVRGNLLMAVANKFNHLLLATSNKSEMAVGYATLYGDMAGALSVIADLPKGEVYELARCYNGEQEIIPEVILTKPPSAELRPDQKDSDSLPAYEVLDNVLYRYVELGEDLDSIVAAGFDAAVVERIVRLLQRSEYKRWQAPPVLRVTYKSFGSGRRLPLAARYNA